MDLALDEFNAAQYLCEGGYYREAASRAYYSMFHATQALLFIREKYPRTHTGVIAQFGLEFIKSGELEAHYAELLTKAEILRTKADYDVERTVGKTEVDEVLESCAVFLDKVKDIISQIK